MSKKETVTEFVVGERLDKVLAAIYTDYSRALLSKLIDNASITVNDVHVKTKYKMKPGDVIQVDLDSLKLVPEELELPVIYEDDDVIVINKPTGVLTHSKGILNLEPTVASFLTRKLTGTDEWRQTNRAGIVHRLDRVTSGVIICAKNEKAAQHLQREFANRHAQKTYLAKISGRLPEDEGMIDVPIERNPKKPATFRAGMNGKAAQTKFKVMQADDNHSLVELYPVTGRTHQLRVHLTYLKKPIVGDELYGTEPADRLYLHAWKLKLTLPSGETKQFEAPLPQELTHL